MIVNTLTKGKRTDKLFPATNQCALGSHDKIITLDKFILSHFLLLCQ